MTDSNPRKKKPIAAKIVKHAHRRRFQEYVRTKGRDKSTIAYVYLSMYLRSGKGNVFELEEGLFLGDLGIGKNALRSARAELVKDGWLSKQPQKIDPLTGKWGTTQWIVNEEPVAVAHSEGVDTDAPLTDDRSTDDGSAGDRSEGDTVVLHSLYANASTYPQATPSDCTPKGVTSSESSEGVSEQATSSNPEEKETLKAVKPDQKQSQNQFQLEPVAAPMSGAIVDTDDVYKHIGRCFPAYRSPSNPKARYEDERMMQEIILTCDAACKLPIQVLDYARTHKRDTPRLVPRSIKQFWNAICSHDASTTNGLLIQCVEDDPKTCGFCAKELASRPCDHCHGTTWGKPVVIANGNRYDGTFCQECSKLPEYRRGTSRSNENYLTAEVTRI
jgi:hypothetical protein